MICQIPPTIASAVSRDGCLLALVMPRPMSRAAANIVIASALHSSAACGPASASTNQIRASLGSSSIRHSKLARAARVAASQSLSAAWAALATARARANISSTTATKQSLRFANSS
jgi:hypothetical protein